MDDHQVDSCKTFSSVRGRNSQIVRRLGRIGGRKGGREAWIQDFWVRCPLNALIVIPASFTRHGVPVPDIKRLDPGFCSDVAHGWVRGFLF